MDDTTNPTGNAVPDDSGGSGDRPLSESAWEAIGAATAHLEEAWRQGTPPDIGTLVPADADPVTQRAVLVHLVAIDLEWRWKTAATGADQTAEYHRPDAGQSQTVQYQPPASAPLPPRPRLADYVARYPVLGPVEGLPAELLVGEYYARRRYGDQPARDEYLEKFGSLHPDLARQLQAIDEEVAKAAVRRDPGPADDGLPPGTKVEYFGDYVLLERLGKGGMGVVYKARQVSLKRLVAVKMILAGQLADQQDIQRFHVEAEAAANLDHPGIVQIHEIGEHLGQHYFSMDFVEGESLAERLRQGPLVPRDAARLVEQVARAIAYAHGRGVIHRDLKPANILVDRQSQPRVTDFGLAKRVEGDSDLTATVSILGTPSYMPPEQAEGRLDQISERSDVYSLGATLYALLVGRPPFQAATPWETLAQVRAQAPVPLRKLNNKLSRDLETICAKCLEKDPRRRYSSAAELADDLRRFLLGERIHARRAGALEFLSRNHLVHFFVLEYVTLPLLWTILAGSAASLFYYEVEITFPSPQDVGHVVLIRRNEKTIGRACSADHRFINGQLQTSVGAIIRRGNTLSCIETCRLVHSANGDTVLDFAPSVSEAISVPTGRIWSVTGRELRFSNWWAGVFILIFAVVVDTGSSYSLLLLSWKFFSLANCRMAPLYGVRDKFPSRQPRFLQELGVTILLLSTYGVLALAGAGVGLSVPGSIAYAPSALLMGCLMCHFIIKLMLTALRMGWHQAFLAMVFCAYLPLSMAMCSVAPVLRFSVIAHSLADGAVTSSHARRVNIIYLAPADRMVRGDFKCPIEAAAKDLQAWYAKQLGGPTFRLNEPVAEVVKSDKEAKWFYNHPNGDQKDDWGFNNGLAEARRLPVDGRTCSWSTDEGKTWNALYHVDKYRGKLQAVKRLEEDGSHDRVE